MFTEKYYKPYSNDMSNNAFTPKWFALILEPFIIKLLGIKGLKWSNYLFFNSYLWFLIFIFININKSIYYFKRFFIKLHFVNLCVNFVIFYLTLFNKQREKENKLQTFFEKYHTRTQNSVPNVPKITIFKAKELKHKNI